MGGALMSPTDWTYGEEGLAFPTADGQVWQAGRHTFVCSDLMASTLFDEILEKQLADGQPPGPRIVYCDPPWNQGNINSFRTKAKLEKATHRWDDLYKRIAALGDSRDWPVWAEGSTRENRYGAMIPDALGGSHTGYAEITYYKRNPCGLFYAGPKPAPKGLLQRLDGQDDENTPGIVMKAYGSSGLVIDPCAGRGLTSRHAEREGWTAVTNELNPRRLSAAMFQFRKVFGVEGTRVA